MSNRRRFKSQMRAHGDWWMIGCNGANCWCHTMPEWAQRRLRK